MRRCPQCGSSDIIEVSAKTSDRLSLRGSLQGTGFDYDGYTPKGLGLGENEDYIRFAYCAKCGQMAGSWPQARNRVQVYNVEVDDLDEPVKVRIVEGLTKLSDVVIDILTDEAFFEVYGDVDQDMVELEGVDCRNGVVEVYSETLSLRISPQARR